jgi:hypothetical protein
MNHISQNPKEFLEALKKGSFIAIGADGKWFIEGFFTQITRRLFGLEESRTVSLSHALEAQLDLLEKISIKFDPQSKTNIEQDFDFKSIIEASELVLKMLNKITSQNAKECGNRLKRKLIALQYRLEASNGGIDPAEIRDNLWNELKQLALLWLKKQIATNKDLTIEAVQILAEATTYHAFIELLLVDNKLQEVFFEWVLRDKNSLSPFIQYPFIQSKIVDCALSGRIGRHGGKSLKITKTLNVHSEMEKILTLTMEGKPVSLLDEARTVTFKGNYTLSIKELFEIFKNKMFKVGNLEFFDEGICNWNCHHLGYWDADKKRHEKINLSSPTWWKKLPIFEILSRKNAARRYGMLLDGKQWVVTAKATRGFPTLNYEKTHAFMEVAIPREDGSYVIYDFGKFSYQFPSSFFNSLLTFCLNMHATIAYPDENVFYTERQHGSYPFIATRAEGLLLMELLKEDMIKSRNYNLVFQIESENCAKWLYEKLTVIFGNKVPNFFRMSLMKTEPIGFIGAYFKLLRKFNIPESIQFKLLTLIHIPFGANKVTRIEENGKMVMKALTNHEFWNTSEIYLPAFLIAQIEAGSFKSYTSPYLSKALYNQMRNNEMRKKSIFFKLNQCLDKFKHQLKLLRLAHLQNLMRKPVVLTLYKKYTNFVSQNRYKL